MSTILATQNGVWSATSTWTGGVVPTTGDVAVANGKTVTVDQSLTVSQLRNDTTGGATPGGTFTWATTGYTITADIYAGATNPLNCVAFTGNSPATATIVGNATGGGGSAVAVNNTGTGTLTFTGNATGSASGTVGYGLINASTGVVNMTGNSVDQNTSAGTANAAGGTFNLTGNTTGSPLTNYHGSMNLGVGTFNLYGTAYGGIANSATGIYNNSSGPVNATNAVGGANVSSHGVYNASTGTVTVTGLVTGGSTSSAYGVYNAGTGTVTVDTAIGNDYGPGGTSSNPTPGVYGAVSGSLGRTFVKKFQHGPHGQCPVGGAVFPVNSTFASFFYQFIETDLATTKTAYFAESGSLGYPVASDVRYGTVFGGGGSTGSCHVPAAASVAYGVSVDATVGIAVLTQAALQANLGAIIAAFDV